MAYKLKVYSSLKSSNIIEVFPNWRRWKYSEILNSIYPKLLIEKLALLNFILRRDDNVAIEKKHSDIIHGMLQSRLTDQIKFGAIHAILTNLKANFFETTFVIHRLLLLNLIKESLKRSFKRKPKKILKLGEKLMYLFFYANDNLEITTKTNDDIAYLSIFRSYYLAKEFQFAEILARYYAIFELNTETEELKFIRSKFEEIYGFNINDMLMNSLLLLTNFLTVLSKDNNLFINPNTFLINAEYYYQNILNKDFTLISKRIIRSLSLSAEEFKKEVSKEEKSLKKKNRTFAFSTIAFKPFLRYGEDNYFLLDLKFLELQTSKNIIFQILKKIDRKEGHDLKAKYGKIIESHWKELLIKQFPKSPSGLAISIELIFPEDENNNSGVDFGFRIESPNNKTLFVLIELTTQRLGLKNILDLDVSKFKDDIQGILFGNEEKSQKKYKQFKTSETWVLSNLDKWGISDKNSVQFKRILVMEDPIPSFHKFWDIFYIDIIKKNTEVEFDINEQYIYFFDFTDFDYLISTLTGRSKIGAEQILDTYKNNAHINFAEMCIEKGVLKPDYLKEFYDIFIKEMNSTIKFKNS